MSSLDHIRHPGAPKELGVLLNNSHTHDSLVEIEHDGQSSKIGNRLDHVVSRIILVKQETEHEHLLQNGEQVPYLGNKPYLKGLRVTH